MDGYDTYCLYTGLKLHFSPGKYDYFKYYGRTKTSVHTFELRKDRYFFHKLARKYPIKDDLLFFLAANFFSSNIRWVRELLTEEAHQTYLDRLRIRDSLDYMVKQDLADLPSNTEDFKTLLSVKEEYPPLFVMVTHGTIREETLIVLNAVIDFLPVWSGKITDTILYPDFAHKVIRYAPFLQIDVKNFQHILRSHLT